MGLFIAFEGIDGCGKSTQFQRFAKYLFESDKYNHVVLTRNPYKDGNIREMIKGETDPLAKAEKLADLFIKDRTLQAEEIVIPNLKKDLFVLTDRFKLSTIAYQAAQGLDMGEMIEKQRHLPVPNITFIFDVSAEIAAKRMSGENRKEGPHRFEADLRFLEDVRQNFLKAAKMLVEEKIFIINSERSKDEIFQEIVEIFERENKK